MNDIKTNFLKLKTNLLTDIKIVAISKKQSADKIILLLEEGHKNFGENYINEAQEKWPSLKNLYPDIKLHLTGHLQTNKIKEALELFDVIETIDSDKIAIKIKQQLELQPKELQFFTQVNIGEESQKHGILPQHLTEFIQFCQHDIKLLISGLMCIPTNQEPPAPYFALLKKLAKNNNLLYLSMGMSSDYKIAARFGATHLRIGQAIFGERSV